MKTSGKWNFIGPDSRVAFFVTDVDVVYEFSDGLALVREADGKWNYLITRVAGLALPVSHTPLIFPGD